MSDDMSDDIRAAAGRLESSAAAWLRETDPDDADPDDVAHWRDQLAVARACLAGCSAAGGGPWRLIGTAPKDGTEVLVWDGVNMYLASWWENLGGWESRGGSRLYPTHWMPPPEPPASAVPPPEVPDAR